MKAIHTAYYRIDMESESEEHGHSNEWSFRNPEPTTPSASNLVASR